MIMISLVFHFVGTTIELSTITLKTKLWSIMSNVNTDLNMSFSSLIDFEME